MTKSEFAWMHTVEPECKGLKGLKLAKCQHDTQIKKNKIGSFCKKTKIMEHPHPMLVETVRGEIYKRRPYKVENGEYRFFDGVEYFSLKHYVLPTKEKANEAIEHEYLNIVPFADCSIPHYRKVKTSDGKYRIFTDSTVGNAHKIQWKMVNKKRRK